MAAGKALATGVISAKVVALTEGVLKAMLMTKIKVAIAVLLAVNVVGASVGLVYCQTTGSGQDKQEKTLVVQEKLGSPVAPAQQPNPKKDDAERLQEERKRLAGLQAGMTSDQVLKVLGKPDEIRRLTEGQLLDGKRLSGEPDYGPETERWAYGILGKGLFAKVGYVSIDHNGKVIAAMPADQCLHTKKDPFERVAATSDEAVATSSKMSCHIGPLAIVPPEGESTGAFTTRVTLKNAGKEPFELKYRAAPSIDALLLIEVYDSAGTMLFREDNMLHHLRIDSDARQRPLLSIPPGKEKSDNCSIYPAFGFGRLPPGQYSVRAYFPLEKAKYYPSNLVRFEVKENQQPTPKTEGKDDEKRDGGADSKAAAGTPPAKIDAPQPLPENIVTAWKEAGARVGWMRVRPDSFDADTGGGLQVSRISFFQFVPEKEGKPGDLPAFSFNANFNSMDYQHHPNAVPRGWLPEVRLAKLPAPALAFGLDLVNTQVTDAGLKELAGLKSLQMLDLRHTQITDAGLKELAGLKNLQVLSLSNTKVTDAGLKELAGLKSLQALKLGAPR